MCLSRRVYRCRCPPRRVDDRRHRNVGVVRVIVRITIGRQPDNDRRRGGSGGGSSSSGRRTCWWSFWLVVGRRQAARQPRVQLMIFAQRRCAIVDRCHLLLKQWRCAPASQRHEHEFGRCPVVFCLIMVLRRSHTGATSSTAAAANVGGGFCGRGGSGGCRRLGRFGRLGRVVRRCGRIFGL